MKKILLLLVMIIILGAVNGFLWVALRNKNTVKNYRIGNTNDCMYDGSEAECNILEIDIKLSVGQENLDKLERIFKDNNAEIVRVLDLNAINWRIYKIKVSDEKIFQFQDYLKGLGYNVRYAIIGHAAAQ
jgi:hypothetical protein